MQLINKKSHEIIALTGAGNKKQIMTVKKGTIYLVKSFCVSNKMKAGQFLHFINEGSEWRFICNNDADGFKLIDDKRKNGSLLIYNSALTHLIRQSTGHLGTVSFPIETTALEHGGCRVFMLMTHKPIKS